jgi:hypothetical protein
MVHVNLNGNVADGHGDHTEWATFCVSACREDGFAYTSSDLESSCHLTQGICPRDDNTWRQSYVGSKFLQNPSGQGVKAFYQVYDPACQFGGLAIGMLNTLLDMIPNLFGGSAWDITMKRVRDYVLQKSKALTGPYGAPSSIENGKDTDRPILLDSFRLRRLGQCCYQSGDCLCWPVMACL